MHDPTDQLREWSKALSDAVEPADIERIKSPMASTGGLNSNRRWLAVAASVLVVGAGIFAVATLGNDEPDQITPATSPPDSLVENTTATTQNTAPPTSSSPTTLPPIAPVDELDAVPTSSIAVLGWPGPADIDTVPLAPMARRPDFVSGPPTEATVWLFTDDEGRRCVEVQQLDGSQTGQCVDADTDAALEARTSSDNDGSTYVIGTTADTAATAVVTTTGNRSETVTLHTVDGWNVRVFAGRFTEWPQRVELIGPTGTVINSSDLEPPGPLG